MNKKLSLKNKYQTILGIDTSCDETSVGIVRGTTVLSNVVSTQVELHRKYGGVVPSIARREHELRIAPAVAEAFKSAGRNTKKKLTPKDIDAVAVTYGPGLAIALEVGIKKAKELALAWNVPLIAVNHMEGHLLSPLGLNSRGNGNLEYSKLKFPVMGLLISGGHTEIVIMQDFGKYEILGQTVDDAVGEAYDKVARMLGLGYPGGKVLSELARSGDPEKYHFPVPMAKDPSLNFSFSGLKTAVYYTVRESEKEGRELSKQDVYDLAAGFEKSAIKELQIKLQKAITQQQPKVLLVGGGVSSSAKVRAGIRDVCRAAGVKVYFPVLKNIFTDNGAMIAIAGYFKAQRREFADSDLDREPGLHL
jgi:N6-L-threonylcarbamoyladenine synthase